MTDVTAIDILVEPDRAALDRASAENAVMRAEYADGFALDALHKPHVTLLQRYVRTADLDGVLAAVEALIGSHSLYDLTFRAHGIRHMPVAAVPGHGLAAIVVTPGPEVLALQSTLIDAVAPFVETGGTPAAFVTTAEEPEINADTLTYVERYVPDHSGANFLAHLTVGLAPLDFLVRVEKQHFDSFEFHLAGIAVYQLGNNGTARRELRTWRAAASL
jgi:hypothetical protein